jgi:hypothetical protein
LKLDKTVQPRGKYHLREYLEELQNEIEWDRQFRRTQPRLIAAAKRAKQEIAQGQAQPIGRHDEYERFCTVNWHNLRFS